MTKRNILLSKWISQIRKILSDSPVNHCCIITQKINKLDKNWRDLLHVIVECKKAEYNKKVYILQKYYEGEDGYINNKCKAKKYFLGNPYFRYYDSYDMVRFTDAEEYV